MTAIKTKEQLARELFAVKSAVINVYHGLDMLNGALYPVCVGTDLKGSLAEAGVVGNDAEIAVTWINDWYRHQMPSNDDLDTLLDVLDTYIGKLTE